MKFVDKYDYYVNCMIDIIDISNWNVKPWQNPQKGNREKFYIENENGEGHYFKKSLQRYPSEYWSEILASKIGKHLGFDVVEYSLAEYKNDVGCICRSVLGTIGELIHGQQLLLSIKPDYDIVKGTDHSFQLIKESIERHPRVKDRFEYYIENIVAMIIFDAIIGNQDRHQENWAIIYSIDLDRVNKIRDLLKILYCILVRKKNNRIFYKFSPLYDNGSSLGREFDKKQLSNLLNNDSRFEKYINRSLCHIRWGLDQISHFELIKQLKFHYPELIKDRFQYIFNKYNNFEFKELIEKIDDNLVGKYAKYKLEEERKEFVFRLVNRRLEILKEVIK